MRTADDLQPPVGHDSEWLLLALGALLLVAAYYVVVLWWGRPGSVAAPGDTSPRAAADDWSGRIEEIATDVDAGRLSARHGHQQLSLVVRGAVFARTGTPATSMTLADLRRAEPNPSLGQVTEFVELIYPAAFSADPDRARAEFATALVAARRVVAE